LKIYFHVVKIDFHDVIKYFHDVKIIISLVLDVFAELSEELFSSFPSEILLANDNKANQ